MGRTRSPSFSGRALISISKDRGSKSPGTFAQPTLPESIRAGLSVTLAVKQPIRAVVCLTSRMSRRDIAMMSGMANQLKNDLARIPGVGAIADLGAAEQRLRIRSIPTD